MIFINNQNVEFRKAAHLLGLTVSEKSKIIREELGDKRISILCIGPAGENLSRIAAIMSDDRAAGRCGGRGDGIQEPDRDPRLKAPARLT